MNWIYKGKEWQPPTEGFTPEEMYGFVYQITNKQNQKKYIGKKFFWKQKTLPITKKRKRRKRLKVESDWREYYGSSKHLSEDVEKMGHKNFHREIILFCKTKGECAYMETKIQFERAVLLSDDYYNGIVNCRIGSNSVKHLKEA
jgi:hypothetical protein